VFLSLALSRVLRAAKPTAHESRLFAVSLAAVIMSVTLGAVLCAQWDPIGVPYEKDWRVAVPAVPVERDVQIRALLKMWKTVNRERADSNATRNEITTIPPREWAQRAGGEFESYNRLRTADSSWQRECRVAVYN